MARLEEGVAGWRDLLLGGRSWDSHPRARPGIDLDVLFAFLTLFFLSSSSISLFFRGSFSSFPFYTHIYRIFRVTKITKTFA